MCNIVQLCMINYLRLNEWHNQWASQPKLQEPNSSLPRNQPVEIFWAVGAVGPPRLLSQRLKTKRRVQGCHQQHRPLRHQPIAYTRRWLSTALHFDRKELTPTKPRVLTTCGNQGSCRKHLRLKARSIAEGHGGSACRAAKQFGSESTG